MPHQPVKDNNEKKEKLDYKIFRQEIKSDKTTKYFEVKLIIREITGDKSTIIGKYLFFKEDGTFQTKVLNKENNESYMIEGKLNNDGTFEFKRDVMTNKYVYKGKIPLEELKNPSQIVISGKVYINGNESNDTTFTISLPNCTWNIQYSEKTVQKNSMIYMKIKKVAVVTGGARGIGKAITEEAVVRGSMGTVIIEFMMDCLRERDYNRDLDFTKLAWIDGLDTSYRDIDGNLKYISLDVNNHVYADYIIKAKNSVKEQEKLRQLQQFAFSAAQNGDNMMAIAAIQGDNVATISKLIKKYQEEKNAHEEQLKQLDQQTAQMEQEFEIQKIQIQGEENRKTEELKGYINQQIELIKADANLLSYNQDLDDTTREDSLDRLDTARSRVEQEKLNNDRQKTMLDAYSKERDRQVKLHDIDTKLKIAKENRNRYDFKSTVKKKK